MKLINGKFYEGGKEVRLEFGNKEQIRLLNQVDKKIKELKGDGLFVCFDEITMVTVSIDFDCVCGVALDFGKAEFDEIDYNRINVFDHFNGKKTTCRNCKRKYILQESDGHLVVKFNNNSND